MCSGLLQLLLGFLLLVLQCGLLHVRLVLLLLQLLFCQAAHMPFCGSAPGQGLPQLLLHVSNFSSGGLFLHHGRVYLRSGGLSFSLYPSFQAPCVHLHGVGAGAGLLHLFAGCQELTLQVLLSSRKWGWSLGGREVVGGVVSG